MAGPIATLTGLPVYATVADLTDEGDEAGDAAVTLAPPALWLHDGDSWTQVAPAEPEAGVAARVARLEARLACLATCLTD